MPPADLDAGTASAMAHAVAAELGAWLEAEGIWVMAEIGTKRRTCSAVGHLPGVRPATLAARLGALLPVDWGLDPPAVRLAMPAEPVAPLRGHSCRRVEGRALVRGVPVVVTLEPAEARIRIIATVVAD